MSRLLIERCEVVAVMDDAGTELAGGSILIEDGRISWVGSGAPPGAEGVERIDGRGCVAAPGLVNTHHHLFQTLTRARAQDKGLFDWLVELYPVWASVDEEWVGIAARVGLAELALSGCSTTTDHHYIFPAGAGDLMAAEIDAARQIGLRFHPARGSMDRGESGGGLPPDATVEDTDSALEATEDAVRRFHDPSPGSMLRIAVAPCSPFSVSERLMRGSAELARRLRVRLHTHVAETLDEERHCLERFGGRPLELLEEWGWLGEDVWLAHCVHLDGDDVKRMGVTSTGAAWCPSSNLRLASGIAPARALLDAGAPVGLGVDGSASNDAGDLLAEARQGLLVARAGGDPTAMSARQVLRAATRGGAACLGREDELGSLGPGKRADVALFDLTGLGHAGAQADPVAALVFTSPGGVRDLLVEGRPVVRDGHLVRADEEAIAAQGRRRARSISGGAGPGGGG
ncbi:MAG TPA: 8-oxoguanine deaminase [Actinomycetota bacterium]|nr:8-oxoguanine deaminase [Actinomycetota bacterium]